jgi:hypothetical protein
VKDRRDEKRRSSCWIALSKRGVTGILKLKQFVLSGEFVLEEALDLSQDRLRIKSFILFLMKTKL